MTSLDHLLPEPDERVRCADHSRRLAIDPGGTAIRADRVILIDTPLPWPKPVFGHELLAEAAPVLARSTVVTRTLAAVPLDDSGPPQVVVFDRGVGPGAAVAERRFVVSGAQDLVGLAEALAADDPAAAEPWLVAQAELAEPVVLVCTQGSHDICCGSEGTRFAADAESLGDVRVRRVSHTGGHRFAPTLMTLPDGRMWADADVDLLRRVVYRLGTPAEVADRCRGWWGADTGPAQMAERAVFAGSTWEDDPSDREVVTAAADGNGRTRCEVRWGDARIDVTVEIGREVPTIACREPGGQPTKPGREYRVVDRVGP